MSRMAPAWPAGSLERMDGEARLHELRGTGHHIRTGPEKCAKPELKRSRWRTLPCAARSRKRTAPKGTGSGLARHLRASGVEVVEVDRPNRQSRRRTGKSDPADAIEASRAALSGRAQGAGKTKDGNVEAIRALVVAKRSARSAKIQALNQIRNLVVTAPEDLRQQLKGASRQDIATMAAALRPRQSTDQVGFATRTALSMLGRRALALDAEKEGLDEMLERLVEKTAPELLGRLGVGVDTAATLLVTAGDNPGRTRSEAAHAGPPKASKRRLASSRSVGVIVRYTAVEPGSTWPMKVAS